MTYPTKKKIYINKKEGYLLYLEPYSEGTMYGVEAPNSNQTQNIQDDKNIISTRKHQTILTDYIKEKTPFKKTQEILEKTRSELQSALTNESVYVQFLKYDEERKQYRTFKISEENINFQQDTIIKSYIYNKEKFDRTEELKMLMEQDKYIDLYNAYLNNEIYEYVYVLEINNFIKKNIVNKLKEALVNFIDNEDENEISLNKEEIITVDTGTNDMWFYDVIIPNKMTKKELIEYGAKFFNTKEDTWEGIIESWFLSPDHEDEDEENYYNIFNVDKESDWEETTINKLIKENKTKVI